MTELDAVLIPFAVSFVAVIVVTLVVCLIFIPRPSKIKDSVPGLLHITGLSEPLERTVYQTLSITGVLITPDRGAIPVSFKTLVHTAKFPSPGQELPVYFSDSNPEKINIQWDLVPKAGMMADLMAQAQAAQFNRNSTRTS